MEETAEDMKRNNKNVLLRSRKGVFCRKMYYVLDHMTECCVTFRLTRSIRSPTRTSAPKVCHVALSTEPS